MSNVFVSLPDVKINNSYSYYRAVAPTTTEKAPAYTNGQTWLDTVTGLSYELTEQVGGTWGAIETDIDSKIDYLLDPTCDAVLEYLSNKFIVSRNVDYFDTNTNSFDSDLPDRFNREEAFTLVNAESVYSNFTFDKTAKTITVTTDADVFGALTDSFQAGDIIYIGKSKRNDNYYTVASVTATAVTIDESTLTDGSANCFIFLVDVPAGLVTILGRMVWYDVYQRPLVSGLSTERVGTYSWTKSPLNNGMRYPDDIIAGLDNYTGIVIGGRSIFVN